MKYIIIILTIVISLMSCQTQNKIVVEATHNNIELELGKCYFSVIQNDGTKNQKKEKGFILELVPPKFEDTEIRYSDEQLKDYEIENEKYLLPFKKLHTEFLIKNENLSEFAKVENPIGFIYCLVEVPAEYRIISKLDLLNGGNKVTEKIMISNSKIIKRYVKKRPKKLLKNQYFFKSGYWSELQEANAYHRGGMGNRLILKIKRKLIERGYELTEDNILDEKTREALRDFQKKNGLKVGQLDQATLQKLGVRQ